METPYPLQDDFTFEKLRFRHSERLSREVFELMDGGKKIYPQEGLNDFADIMDKICTTTEFSQEAFDYAMENTEFFSTATEAEAALSEIIILERPIQIVKNHNPIQVSRQRIRASLLALRILAATSSKGLLQPDTAFLLAYNIFLCYYKKRPMSGVGSKKVSYGAGEKGNRWKSCTISSL